MSFLFPLYLLGAAALAVPILLHLRRRPPKEHIPFSSHLFLEKTPERLTRRTRLERWLLLALRCLALLLLALAFSRPFLESMTLPSEAGSRTRAIILVDRSASMHREDLWDRTLEAAREAIRRYRDTDEVALAFFDEGFDLAADLPTWAALGTSGRIRAFDEFVSGSDFGPSWRATVLDDAMIAASDLLLAADAESPAGRREMVVIGDFQDGAERDRLPAEAWPEEVSVLVRPIAVENPGNLSLNLAATPPRANIEEAEVYRVRIRNGADSDFASATVSWKGFPETAIETTVAPGTSRIITSAPRPPGATEGVLVVEGDEHPFDNEVYVSPVQARPLRVHFLSENGIPETAGSPLFYLRRALQPTPTLNPIVTASEQLDPTNLEESEVVVIAGSWKTETGEALRQFAETGGLVIALPSEEAAGDSLAVLAGTPDWKLSEGDPGDYALLADLDFEHPVLQPFARAQIRDFTKIRFWKHRNLKLPEELPEDVRVIATFDGETPAFVERRIGKGTVFAALSGWEPRESQLALSSKFVPLLFSVLEHSGFSIRSAATLYVGEGTNSQNDYPRPGFYPESEGESSGITAVNLRPSEGNTASFDPIVIFRDWGISLVDEAAEASRAQLGEAQLARLESEEKEENQKLWKWLILGTLLLLILESWIAGRPYRMRPRKSAAAGTTPAPSPS